MKNSPIALILASRIHGVIAEAEALKVLPHTGLRGRFREIVLTRLIGPLMPPSCVALHGTAVDTEGKRFETGAGTTKTEDDVLVVDRDRVPSFLFTEGEGIVPIEAVLAKIEVKSVLTSDELRDAISGAITFLKTPLVLPDEDLLGGAALQCIFAFGSDLRDKDDHVRLIEMLETERWASLGGAVWDAEVPPIHAMCVVGKGMWAYASLKAESPAGGISARRMLPIPKWSRSSGRS